MVCLFVLWFLLFFVCGGMLGVGWLLLVVDV